MPFERNAEVVNTGFKGAFYFVRTLADQLQYAVVVSQDVGSESGDLIFTRNSDQELGQKGPDASPLPLVMDCNGDLRVLAGLSSAYAGQRHVPGPAQNHTDLAVRKSIGVSAGIHEAYVGPYGH